MKRIVTENNLHGNSYILSQEITNIETPLKELDDRFRFYNLWTTNSMPVDLNLKDPVKDNYVSTSPVQNGSMFRIVNYSPEVQLLERINQMSITEPHAFEQKIGIKLSLNSKHPLMHTTPSINFGIVLSGEIYLVLDEDEILLKPMDTIIQRGTSHAWSNRSAQDCIMAYVLLDARQKDSVGCDYHD